MVEDREELLIRTRNREQYYKNRCRELEAQLAAHTRHDETLRRADDLAEVASELPDFLKTPALRRALSNYRKWRRNDRAQDR